MNPICKRPGRELWWSAKKSREWVGVCPECGTVVGTPRYMNSRKTAKDLLYYHYRLNHVPDLDQETVPS